LESPERRKRVRPQLLAVSGSITVAVAVIAVVGTAVGVLLGQFFEDRRDSKRRISDLENAREQWLRDRRVDLYVRTTSLYLEALDIIKTSNSNLARHSSLETKGVSHIAEMSSCNAEFEVLTSRGASLSGPDASALQARMADLSREDDRIRAELERLKADEESLAARHSSNDKELVGLTMPFQLLASKKVRDLAGPVIDEITKAGLDLDEGREYVSKALSEKWEKLHSGMREDLKISD
jgi:hypothetical protein